MNTSQFAFIICANNEQYYSECVRYIQDIYVPENYSIDIICIQEADSMAQGYNAGMRSSDARYKIYLHQDTFILNKNFLYDILRIFNSDERIGLIGVLGVRELPEDADCYLKWDTGVVTAHNGKTVLDLKLYQNKDKAYIPVKAVDGLIMITQTDIPWREDFLDGWDFMTFRNRWKWTGMGIWLWCLIRKNLGVIMTAARVKLKNIIFTDIR